VRPRNRSQPHPSAAVKILIKNFDFSDGCPREIGQIRTICSGTVRAYAPVRHRERRTQRGSSRSLFTRQEHFDEQRRAHRLLRSPRRNPHSPEGQGETEGSPAHGAPQGGRSIRDHKPWSKTETELSPFSTVRGCEVLKIRGFWVGTVRAVGPRHSEKRHTFCRSVLGLQSDPT